MPFPKQTAKPFTHATILALKNGRKGCYGLIGGGRMIFIGKGDIKGELLALIEGQNPCVTTNCASHWVEEVTDNLDYEERRLIQEYRPTCNQPKVGVISGKSS